MKNEQIHFLTGRLAENALRTLLTDLSEEMGGQFSYTVQVMPITVAALMTPDWIAKKIAIPVGSDRVLVPGYCQGDLSGLSEQFGIPIESGPKDLRQLPVFFGQNQKRPDLNNYNIEIIAEINHAPLQSISDVVELAMQFSQSGADIIDIGCVPGQPCLHIGDFVKAVTDQGLRVSIDSLDIGEIEHATAAGAELVLSVNKSNRHAAVDWGCEVVVIPDDISKIVSMQETIDFMIAKRVPFRIDPILEPIGLGFADSLNRYYQARKRWPDFAIMMGVGNLTELTDVDSAGVNFLLLGICEELAIHSVLTTQVINWARSSIAECDLARRIVHHAFCHSVPPKNLSGDLVSLRDARLLETCDSQIEDLAQKIKDNNYRIMTSSDQIHLLGSGKRFSEADPFLIFDQLAATNPENLDAAHAFYLGFEMCKAMMAVQLGKNYIQDEALDWGHLTVDEVDRHRLSRRSRSGSG